MYSESKLTDKYEKLKKLKKQSIENNSILSISWYAKYSSDIEDFFSEIFAVYVRGGNLPEEMKLYVLEVIDAGI
ncbi:MAG: hypothetical protein IKC23_06150 [Fibrobacter sp.]|nr:hypothetical protein [Fibrobacter sp.]